MVARSFGRRWRSRWRRAADETLLGHADFRRFWAAEGISLLGSQITIVALPLLAALTVGASPLQMGALAAMSTLPFLLGGLVVGVWVDRLRRRPIMIAANLGRALILGVIPLAALFDALGIWLLYAVALAAGCCTVWFDIAYASYVPTLVRRDQLLEANGKLEATASIAQVAGPGLAGVLVGVLTAPVAILLDALSYLRSALLVSRIGAPEPEPSPARPSVRAEIGDGLRLVWRNPVLRALAGCSAVTNFFGWMFLGIYILYMTEDLGLGPSAVGLVFAVGGAGAFIGATLAGRIARRLGQGPTLILGQALFGVTGLLVPLAALAPALALPLVVGAEFGQWLTLLIYTVNALSLRQTIVPDAALGRVTATFRVLNTGVVPLGSLTGGFLGGVIGLAPTLAFAELGMFVAVGWLLASPIRRIQSSEAVPPASPTESSPVSAGGGLAADGAMSS